MSLARCSTKLKDVRSMEVGMLTRSGQASLRAFLWGTNSFCARESLGPRVFCDEPEAQRYTPAVVQKRHFGVDASRSGKVVHTAFGVDSARLKGLFNENVPDVIRRSQIVLPMHGIDLRKRRGNIRGKLRPCGDREAAPGIHFENAFPCHFSPVI